MPNKDYYQILGVSENAEVDEIKKAFKKLAKRYHPDCSKEKGCEDKFKEISEAYNALADPEKRKQYDLLRKYGAMGGAGPDAADSGAPGWRPGPQGGTYAWTSGQPGPEINFEDLIGNGGLGDIFGEIFGGTRARRRTNFGGAPFGAPYNNGDEDERGHGRDLEADLTVSFEDAMKGGTHRFGLKKSGPCPTCAGAGKNPAGRTSLCSACGGKGRRQVANGGPARNVVCPVCRGAGKVSIEPCPTCAGTGKAAGDETITVKVPAGIADGGRLRVPGKGQAGPDGTVGDLLLRVHVNPHRFFRRDGDHLHLDLPLTVSEAALGAKINVPTLDGDATLSVPPGAKNAAVLRLRGKGAPSPKADHRGDLLVHIKLETPPASDPRIKKLLEEMAKLEPNPRNGKF